MRALSIFALAALSFAILGAGCGSSDKPAATGAQPVDLPAGEPCTFDAQCNANPVLSVLLGKCVKGTCECFAKATKVSPSGRCDIAQ